MRPSFLAAAVVMGLATSLCRADDEPSAFILDNGLRARLVPMKGVERVFVLLGVRAGFCEEPPMLPHVAHVTEHLVVFGHPAGTEEGEAVSRWFRQNRANGETLPGWMYFDLQVEPAELETALRVQAARLARPEFTDKLLAREVPRALAEIAFLEESDRFGPGKFALSAFVQAAFHGETEVPIRARTKTLTVDDARRFHAATFRPDRAMLVVVGEFDPILARKAINTAFGAIVKPPAASAGPRLRSGVLTARWDVTTRHLIVAWPAPPVTSTEHAALSVAAGVLSKRLSADPTLTPLAKMPLVTNDIEGLFLVNVQVRPGADIDALKLRVLEQTTQLATEQGLAALPAVMARRELLGTIRPGGLFASLAPAATRLNARANQELQRLGKAIGWGDLDTYAGRVDTIDPQAIRAAAARFLTAGKAVVVRVEPSMLRN